MNIERRAMAHLLASFLLFFGVVLNAQEAPAPETETKTEVTKTEEAPAEKAEEAAATAEEKTEEAAAATDEKKEEAPTAHEAKLTGVIWDYDKEALKKKVDEAEADKEGSKSAFVDGTITYNFSDGTTRSTAGTFTMTLADGKYATTAAELDTALFTANNVWMMVATFLVFIMHLGFASLETGLTRAKNTTNILFKNTAIIAIGILTFALCGFNIAYPGDSWIAGKFLGFAGPGIIPAEGNQPGMSDSFAYVGGAYTYWTDFLFQAMFAATAATIVSGAVAGRIKLGSFLIFSTIFVAICYPIVVSWQWGGGFLADMGFHDFAGSTLVHSVGGWGALICAIILGARKGKYENGISRAIPGHSLPLATIGVFLLWLGWFGFNGGSVLSGDPNGTSFVLVTTSLAAAAGVIGALLTTWVVQSKPDLTMILNGALAGLVGITAGADQIPPFYAIIVGLIAGILVVISVLFVDQKLKIDDPVGAISVHLVCGIFGTLAVGMFGYKAGMGQFITQLKAVVAVGVFSLASAGILFYALKVTIGVRVEEEEEVRGLDISEHGMEAYGGFQIFSNQ